MSAKSITIVEVGPRDGLQNEPQIVPAAQKIELISRLAGCGIKRIETTACVSPKRVPQMGDYAEVLSALPVSDAEYSALVANQRGADAALAHDTIAEIAVFTAASDEFTQQNIGCSIAESIEQFTPLVAAAKASGRRARGYISTAVVCPFAGDIAPEKTAEVAASLAEIGCDEISLGDTIGAAQPADFQKMLRAVKNAVPQTPLAAHCHDTYNRTLDNIAASLEEGITIIDSSVGGLGGCPFAPGAAGNAASEDVVYFLEQQGYSTGVDLDSLINTGEWICEILGRPYAVKVGST